MAVLLDTATTAASDRPEAFRTALMGVTGCTRVDLEPGAGVSGRMDLWSLGTSQIFGCRSTGVVMIRDSRTARGASPEAVAIAVHGVGQGRHQTASYQRTVQTGDLMVVDITRPYDFSWRGRGSSMAIQVPIQDLGLPLDTVQKAAPRLESSPLYGLVSRHLLEVTRDAERLSAAPTAAALGESTTQLVRALLIGAVDDGARSRSVVEATLLSQLQTYVRQNLHDPELGPDFVARALAISRRQLFRLCAGAGLSLEQFIIGKRLEGAKAELASDEGRSRSIAGVAFSWGFKDPTHFSRRFKAAYGLLPRDWVHLAQEDDQ